MDQKRGNARAFLSYLENSANNGLGEVLTSDCAIHVSAPFGRELAAGPDGARALNAAVSAFATSHRRYEDEFGEGNRLVLQTVNDSVQRGVWNGLFSDRLDLSVRGYKIAEIWRMAYDPCPGTPTRREDSLDVTPTRPAG